jgi:cell division protein FtsL
MIMTQKKFLLLAIGCNIIFLFLYIYKQSAFIQANYSLQACEEQKKNLLQKKEDITHKLQKLKQHTSIKKRAQEMGMRKTDLKQIHNLYATQLPTPPQVQS